MGKVGTDNASFAGFAESESKIAGSAAEIEDQGFWIGKNWAEPTGNAGAPEAIELQREEMIQRVVAGGDLGEHFADFPRGVGFGVGAFGLRAFGGAGGGDVSHGDFSGR